MDNERLLEYILTIIAIVIIAVMAVAGVIDPREAVNYILTIIGYVLGKDVAIRAYRAYKAYKNRRIYSL